MSIRETLQERLSRQNHWRQPVLKSPFHEQVAGLMHGSNWYDWAGYDAASWVNDTELEYFAIRSTAGLFDISPMVKYRIEGPDAEAFLNKLTLRDVTRLPAGRVQYTAWCDDEGFVLDDGTLFRFFKDRFRLCCQERHLPWLLDCAQGFKVEISEETHEIAGLALQGPTSAAILKKADFDISGLKPFQLAEFPLGRSRVTVSRTGFTGDLGYELFVPAGLASDLWQRLWSAGELYGIRAVGYEAVNMARIEAGFIVANADFVTAELALRANRRRRPDEIGLSWMIDMEKDHFNGKRSIAKSRQAGTATHALVGVEIEGNEPAPHAILYHRKKLEVGVISASIWSPLAKRTIGLASVELRAGKIPDQDLWVEIYAMRELQYHRMMKRVRVVERPFVKLPRRTLTPPGDF